MKLHNWSQCLFDCFCVSMFFCVIVFIYMCVCSLGVTFYLRQIGTSGQRHVTCDMWLVRCDMWHMTHDLSHETSDMSHETSDMWDMTCHKVGCLRFFSLNLKKNIFKENNNDKCKLKISASEDVKFSNDSVGR